jgi:transposase
MRGDYEGPRWREAKLRNRAARQTRWLQRKWRVSAKGNSSVHSEQVEQFYLPSYSPELNPDEYLNADLKARMNAGEPVRTPKAMQSKLLGHLRFLQKQPERIRLYFMHEKIRYAA